MSKLNDIMSRKGGGNILLLNKIQNHLASRKLTSDAELVVTRPTNSLGHGAYDAVDVTMNDKKFRITVKEIT